VEVSLRDVGVAQVVLGALWFFFETQRHREHGGEEGRRKKEEGGRRKEEGGRRKEERGGEEW
jgi:hypothetical protein